ncbi:MAG: aldehyde dehydrogenase family protein [Myxococcota bacterium]
MHLPVLRFGQPYESAEKLSVRDALTGEPLASLSLANAALIRRDASRRVRDAHAALQRFTVDQLIACVQEAGRRLMTDALPCGEELLGIEAFCTLTSRATGLPETLVKANLGKLHHVCTRVDEVLNGLARGLDLSVLDTHLGQLNGVPMSWVQTAHSLAALLPSNSPGVHSLWIPALALKTPVALKPGRSDPFVPYRLIQAMIAAGIPREAFAFYPTDHSGADTLVESHDRALVFGGPAVAARYANNPAVEVHGPGYSKVLLGPDQAEQWPFHLETIATSVALNGGRSCINASSVYTTAHASELAHALAEHLAALAPKNLDHPDATLAAFSDPEAAHAIDARIEQYLLQPGAIDLSAAHQPDRVLTHNGMTFLRPTVVLITDPGHPLANTEFGFPFVAVVPCAAETMIERMGPTLVCAAITEDPSLVTRLLKTATIDRLHLGPLPTTSIRWDQPHEGNLLEWLYRRRAIAIEPFGASA